MADAAGDGDRVTRPHLDVRYLGADGAERRGLVTMHASGVITVQSRDNLGPGRDGRTVGYVDIVERVEGDARWMADDFFRLTLKATPLKLQRLDMQFAAIAAVPPEQRGNLRANGRIALLEPSVTLTAGGVVAPGRIVNVSRSGALIESAARASLEDEVEVGDVRATVVRVTEAGFAVMFKRLLPIEGFGPGLRL